MTVRMWIAAVCGLGVVVGSLQAITNRELLEQAEKSLVRVEYTLQYREGEPPQAAGWGQRCPNCGQIHTLGDGGQLVRQERPLETPGFVLDNRTILSHDMMIHPRFVKKIEIRRGDQRLAARISSYAVDHNAVFLIIDEDLPGAEPIAFTAKKADKAISFVETDGLWTLSVSKLSEAWSRREDGVIFRSVPSQSLLVDSEGNAAAVWVDEELPTDDSFLGSPMQWKMIDRQQLDQQRAAVEKKIAAGIAHLRLNFRSPKANSKDRSYYMPRYMDDSEIASDVTEMYTAGIVIEPNLVLVPAKLSPKVTARLEKITLLGASGQPSAGTFAGSLRDYGGFLVRLQRPADSSIEMVGTPVGDLCGKLLWAAQIRTQGENRTVYVHPLRFSTIEKGWRGQFYPKLGIAVSDLYLFDAGGRLAAAPITHRPKGQSEEDRWTSDDSLLTAGCYLQKMAGNFASQLDASNVPLSEEQENRIAWLGVEMQPMTQELARLNNVSQWTQDGQTGGMISYVYADSPAAAAGLEAGDILLRIHSDSLPKPLEVEMDDGGIYDGDFPWAQLDELPDTYFDELPPPWPSVENSLLRSLTDLGFGTAFTAEVFHKGQRITKPMTVQQSPTHYGTAKRFKSEPLGLTVREMTYEVRRYFQQGPQDAGVIVSKLEPGGKAAVAGVRPFEIIIEVNDEPVSSVDEFEKRIAGQDTLKFSIRRMNKGRIVNIKMDSKQNSDTNGNDPNL